MLRRFISLVSHPSLYYSQFVPNSEKHISQPSISFMTMEDCAGEYHFPRSEEVAIGGHYFDLRDGLILIDPRFGEDTVSHEWRHHWQHQNGWEYDGIGWPPLSMADSPYGDQVKAYFQKSVAEMDALLFSRKVTGFIWPEWQEVLKLC